MSEFKSMHARATLDAETFISAFRLHGGYRTAAFRIACMLAGLGLIVGGVFALFREHPLFAVVLTLLGIFVVSVGALSGFQLRNNIHRQFEQMQMDVEELHYEIADRHLRIESKDGNSTLEWGKFCKWKDGGGLILAYRHDKFFIILPVAQLEPAAAALIRDRLATHSRRV